MLGDAVRAAAAAARIAQPDGTGTNITLGFGAPQGTDVRPIVRDDQDQQEPPAGALPAPGWQRTTLPPPSTLASRADRRRDQQALVTILPSTYVMAARHRPAPPDGADHGDEMA